MLFWLKKIISAFLLPLPFGLLLIAIGLFFLIAKQAKPLRNTCLSAGFFIILLFSFNPISATLVNNLQYRYPPLIYAPSNVEYVLVLGGGVRGGKNYPPNLTLDAASLSRLVEGIRLFKQVQSTNANATLILSGGRVFQSPAVAGKMRNTAVMLGVNNQNVLLENGSQDTYQEALYLQKKLGDNPFILVTSAYHMPRSMAIFQSMGMHPVAAPTQFLGYRNDLARWLIPSTNSLVASDIAIHEYLGMAWEKLRGYK
ncbi:MAG: YdcF family protein [Gammaproteobacteria bacterium]|nr:YdcF family protein [Gammaproteobacteria bacterium]